MVEGFWIVQYEGMRGVGGGVAMFIKGRIFGGDSGYLYTGSYEVQGDVMKAYVYVRNFLPNVPSVLGVVGDFELNIEGKIDGDVIRASGSVASAKAVGLALKLTRRFDLPA